MSTWEDKNLHEKISAKLKFQESKYSHYNTSRDRIAELFRPDMDIASDSNSRGDFLGKDIYEGTGPWASRVMSKGLQNNLVSSEIDWIMYIMAAFELRGIDALDVWCQGIKDHMTAAYRRSNYYDIATQFTHDGLTIGSPVMMSEEIVNEQKVMFMPHHYRNCFVFYDRYGRPEGLIIRDKNWTVKQICDKFITAKTPEAKKAEREKKLSTLLNNEINNGDYYKEHTIILAVFKSDDEIWDAQGFTKPFGDYKWYMAYYEKDAEKDKQKEPLSKGGFFVRPFMVWNYNKKPWDSISWTPASAAIWDMASQQQVHKHYIEGTQLTTRMPHIALKSMENRLNFDPEGTMYVDEQEYDRPPKPLEVLGDIRFTKELSEVFRAAIERHFEIDLFKMFSRLPEQIKQPVTATQIIQMMGEKRTLLGGIESYANELLKPADDIIMGVEYEAGRGPFHPSVMANIIDIIRNNAKTRMATAEVMPEFISLLARAQKIAQQLQPIQTGVAALAEIGTAMGDRDYVRLMIKPYETGDGILESLNFPQKNVNTKDEYEGLRDELARQRAADKQTEYAIEMAKAAKGVSGPVDETSILKQAVGAT